MKTNDIHSQFKTGGTYQLTAEKKITIVAMVMATKIMKMETDWSNNDNNSDNNDGKTHDHGDAATTDHRSLMTNCETPTRDQHVKSPSPTP